MGTSLIWWIGISIDVTLLLRGMRTGLDRRYPFFYTYVACVLIKEIIGLLSYQPAPTFYEKSYWPAELATVVASYAVIIEIFRQTLRHNPGVSRLAHKILLVVFVISVSYAASDLLHGGFSSSSRAIAELGRDLRYVEGALLFVMLWLFVRYRILIGRNLLGLILGYSFWVGLNVMNLALWFLPGKGISIGLRQMFPITYDVTLVIWCVSLWSLQPEPLQPSESLIDRDYDRIAAKTRAALAHLSTRVGRTLRP